MIDDTTQDFALLEAGIIFIGLGLIGGAAVLAVVAFALYRSGTRQKVNAVITALSLLSVLAILGYIIGGEERAELIPITALAVGALAAALGQLSRVGSEKSDPSDTINNVDHTGQPGAGTDN